ncbi:transposable element Tcb1 transposase [Trichonephila clavipes]|nr:transposable element Tcb1 transposase [Trichonephila clavipes]
MTHLDDFLRSRNIGRLNFQLMTLKVSEELGITYSVISGLCQRLKNDGYVIRRYSTGLSRATMPNEGRHFAVTVKRKKKSTARDLSPQLSSTTGARRPVI